jgi:hypothetical protein
MHHDAPRGRAAARRCAAAARVALGSANRAACLGVAASIRVVSCIRRSLQGGPSLSTAGVANGWRGSEGNGATALHVNHCVALWMWPFRRRFACFGRLLR